MTTAVKCPSALVSVDPAFLVILLVTGNMGEGWIDTTGKIRQIEVTENGLFY